MTTFQERIVTTIALTLAGVHFYLFQTIMGPFVLGTFFGYTFHPLTEKITNLGIPRFMVSLFWTVVFFVLFFLFLLMLPIFIERQLTFLESQMDSLYHVFLKNIAWIENLLMKTDSFSKPYANPENLSPKLIKTVLWVVQFLKRTGSSLSDIGTVVFYIIVTPLVGYFTLKDWTRIVNFFYNIFPPKKAARRDSVFENFTQELNRCLRRQSIVSGILMLYFMIGFWLLELPFFIILGALLGLLSFIPFLGPTIGFVVCFLSIFPHDPTWITLFKLGGVFIVGEVFNKFFLLKAIIKEQRHLHPIWLLTSVFVSSFLIGPLGALFALPFAAISKSVLEATFLFYKK
jgi:predicted PurR-regulated permease PerM